MKNQSYHSQIQMLDAKQKAKTPRRLTSTEISRLSREIKKLIIKERDKIATSLEQNGLSTIPTLLKTYKMSLLKEDIFSAKNTLQSLEKIIHRGIIKVRQYIHDLRTGSYVFASITLANPLGQIEQLVNLQLKRQIKKAVTDGTNEITRDLHDNVLQSLASLSIELQLCQSLLELDYREALKEYQDLKKLFAEYHQNMEQFCFKQVCRQKDLRLVPTLSAYLKTFSSLSKIEAEVKVWGEESKLSLEFKDNLFQIFKEALRNVKRHAQANKVEINLDFDRDRVRTTIADDGKGFVLDEIGSECFGVRGMRERAQLLGGVLVIQTALGEGTKISVDIPLGTPIS